MAIESKGRGSVLQLRPWGLPRLAFAAWRSTRAKGTALATGARKGLVVGCPHAGQTSTLR